MSKKIISILIMLAVLFCISGCEEKTVTYTGTVTRLSVYEGNYSILVSVDGDVLSTDKLTLGLNSDMTLTDKDGNKITADKFTEGSKISFTVKENYEMQTIYPPILNGCTAVVLEK